MIDIGSAAALVSSLKTAAEITKGIIGLRDASMIQDKVVELNGVILSAQSSALEANAAQFTLLDRVRELEEKVVSFEAWETEKQRYHLQAVDRGAFAYVLKPEMQGAEPPHWLCTNCYDKGHKSFLQFKEQMRKPGGGRGEHSKWVCGSCRSEITVRYDKKPGGS